MQENKVGRLCLVACSARTTSSGKYFGQEGDRLDLYKIMKGCRTNKLYGWIKAYKY